MAEVTCSVANCERPAYCKTFCEPHYRRFKQTGDPGGPIGTRLSGTPEQRFWPRVNKNGPVQPHRPDLGTCWLWTTTASTTNGYPQFRSGNRMVLAYRFAYENVVGPIPDGHQLDHLCHNQHPTCSGGPECPHRKCVNPDHLEPLATTKENCERRVGMHFAPLCRKKLHEMTEDNVRITRSGIRICRTCDPGKRSDLFLRCASGHPRTPDNTYINKLGRMICRDCGVESTRKHRSAGSGSAS